MIAMLSHPAGAESIPLSLQLPMLAVAASAWCLCQVFVYSSMGDHVYSATSVLVVHAWYQTGRLSGQTLALQLRSPIGPFFKLQVH